MFIKQIELRGFKSFGPNKILIKLDKGLTVISGPNGSGKSNIFDAVRFVLGDLSARSLRAAKMAEVIFDGVPTVSPASKMAYVKMWFDNADRRLPIDRNTVTISRRVSRTGTSDYFLNRKRVSRTRLIDILSIADLSSSGYNMIVQGTITRLADVTPEERIKVIENLVGISEYDLKKSEARVQLRNADTNLRIASIRISDVEDRLIRLEEERNEALRYNFIEKEIKKLQAIYNADQIYQIEHEKNILQEDLKDQTLEIELLKKQDLQLKTQIERIELARRKLDDEISDKGGKELVAVQKTIGDLMAKIASLKMEIKLGKTSLKRLSKIKDDRLQYHTSLKKKINEAEQLLSTLRTQRKNVKLLLNEKTETATLLNNKLINTKQNLGNYSQQNRTIEYDLDNLRRKILSSTTRLRGISIRQKIISETLQNLEEKQNNFELTRQNLQYNLKELQKLLQEEHVSLSSTDDLLEKKLSKKINLTSKLNEAEKTLNVAKTAILEFEAKKNLVNLLSSEDFALQMIEELGENGTIPGILGRIENIITVPSNYQRAIDAASTGWLKAILVEDVDTVVKCVENLRKMQIGMIKLIPLSTILDIKNISLPKIEGVINLASNLIRCNERYRTAINFIFGDTIVTNTEQSAFRISRAGYRTVDLNGNLYEAGGGIISGYYRAPVDLSTLLPSNVTVHDLSQSVTSLEETLTNRREYIALITKEISLINEGKTRRSEVVNIIERDLQSIHQNLKRITQNISILNKRISTLTLELKTQNEQHSTLLHRKENDLRRYQQLLSKRKTLDPNIITSTIAEFEVHEKELHKEINSITGQVVKINSEISSLKNSLTTILKPEYNTVQMDIKTLNSQLSTLEKKINNAQSALHKSSKQLSTLKKSKTTLTLTLSSSKDQRRDLEEQLDKFTKQLRIINEKQNTLTIEKHKVELELQTKEFQLNHLVKELHNSGFEHLLNTNYQQIKEVHSTLGLLNFELKKIGSVNQLAVTQYTEQQVKYKQLSLKRNQLEKEKKSIIDFMQDIERRKREAFITAFDNINKAFTTYFYKLTDGGEGYLHLQKPEDPFSGGIDLFVQFPGKTTRLISGSSGGEKSVAAVAFIFAIQQLFPAPFYIFDEIDAHLDPYNSEKLADLLKEQSSNSQFICITLRDVFMDRADKLYGVYIQNGISRVISPRFMEVYTENV
jgi:chromosome segregation protein